MPKTTSEKEYTIKEVLTGGDLIEWRKVCMGGLNDFDVDEKNIMKSIKPSIIEDMEQKAIEIAVDSLEGKSNDVLARVKKLSATDYREIADSAMEKVAELNDLFAGVKKVKTDTGIS